MRKKIIALLIIVTVIYSIVGILLLTNIQMLEAPEIMVEVEVTSLSAEEATLQAVIEVDNPNGFDMIARNIKLVIETPDEYEVASKLIKGGTISANKKTTFTEELTIAFNGRSPEKLMSKISGEFGASILFVQKTIPLKVGVVTSLEKIINDLVAPSISVDVSIDDITTEGLNLSAEITAYNPNAFDIIIGDISAVIETNSSEKVGALDVPGGVIPAKDYLIAKGSGWMVLKALNTEKLIVNLEGTAGAKLAGFEKNLPFNAFVAINIPDLEDILLPKDSPTVLGIKVDRTITLKGLVNYVYLEVNNTFKVDLELRNIVVGMYGIKGDTDQLLGEVKIDDFVAPAGKTTISTGEMSAPFSSVLKMKMPLDWLMISVTADLTVKGVDTAVYLQLRGYQDTHIFRKT